MWIFLKDAFLSIVDPDGSYDGSAGPVGTHLLVRARIKGDIERVFPKAKVTMTPDRDYRFRALVLREEVADEIASAVMNISAFNFKGSVKDNARHDAYMGVWRVMNREQERREPKRGRRGARDLFDEAHPRGLARYYGTLQDGD